MTGFTDSGTSCLILPTAEYEFVIQAILDTLSTYTYDNLYGWGYLFDCAEKSRLPTIDLLYGGYWMEMQVDDYIVEFSGGECAFCVTGTTSFEYAILGQAFMRDFYCVHDMTNGRFGFSPLAGATITKNPAVSGTVPSTSYLKYDG
jgi:hypothetical protein